MKHLTASLAGLVFGLGVATSASADVITEWNQTSGTVLAAAGVTGNPATRAMAMVHVAMADAVNTVQNRYARFAVNLPAQPDASAEVAAAAAARTVLLHIAPAQKAKIDEAMAQTLSRLPDGAAKAGGVALGEQAAAAIIADRATDATNAPDTYRPITTPGVWVPTQPPLSPMFAHARPWVLTSAEQFRPPPPPALSSALYARDYNEVKDFGGQKSSKRTEAQNETVRFWTQPNLNAAWQQAARQMTEAKALPPADSSRVFALMTMCIANAFITEWDAKFHYNFWRPITAIRNGDQDGNDATERDAGWQPSNATPMHPEYPSAAGIQSGCAAATLESAFGAGTLSTPITVTDTVNAQLKRQYSSFAQLAEEQRMVRVWGGIHFRNSVEVGDAMGRRIAAHLLGTTLTAAR